MPEAAQTTTDPLIIQHSHRAPDEAAIESLRELRRRTLDLARWIDGHCPAGRERACAQTKLDETRMWAANALTMSGEIREDITKV